MSNPQELIDTARKAIGDGKSDTDWKIVPSEHAKMFADKAPSLAQNLHGSRPQGLAKMYEEFNDKAIKAQAHFQSTVGRANFSVFCTASLAALLLVTAGLQNSMGDIGPWVVGGIGLLGVISGSLATMWLSQVKQSSFADKWTKERANAEESRIMYFKSVMESASDEPSDQLLVFEYTRRFLLDNQIAFFEGRGGEHEEAAGIALKKSTQAVFWASIFTAIAGLLSTQKPQWAVIAGLGAIASAYATLVVSRSDVNLDRKNADRYRIAEVQLKKRELVLDIYRHKIASGEKGAVKEFFNPIFLVLEADHQRFMSNADLRKLSTEAIEERHDAGRKGLDIKAGGGEEGNPI